MNLKIICQGGSKGYRQRLRTVCWTTPEDFAAEDYKIYGLAKTGYTAAELWALNPVMECPNGLCAENAGELRIFQVRDGDKTLEYHFFEGFIITLDTETRETGIVRPANSVIPSFYTDLLEKLVAAGFDFRADNDTTRQVCNGLSATLEAVKASRAQRPDRAGREHH